MLKTFAARRRSQSPIGEVFSGFVLLWIPRIPSCATIICFKCWGSPFFFFSPTFNPYSMLIRAHYCPKGAQMLLFLVDSKNASIRLTWSGDDPPGIFWFWFFFLSQDISATAPHSLWMLCIYLIHVIINPLNTYHWKYPTSNSTSMYVLTAHSS